MSDQTKIFMIVECSAGDDPLQSPVKFNPHTKVYTFRQEAEDMIKILASNAVDKQYHLLESAKLYYCEKSPVRIMGVYSENQKQPDPIEDFTF